MRQDFCRNIEKTAEMLSSTTRLLKLLTLLQSRPRWTGPELAGRLAVSARTLRYDIDKLRELGYPVHGEQGPAGGYQLRAGTTVPPLLLDDDEAVALAIGLRLATGSGGDLGESAATALAKLEQVLPRRLHGRVSALRGFTATVTNDDRRIDPELILFLTTACRDRQRVRFDYTTRDGRTGRREVEPYRVLHFGGRWYLTAFDPERDDWRSFRLDRLEAKRPAGARFTPRVASEPAALLNSIDVAYRKLRAVVLVAAAADDVVRRVPSTVPVEPVDTERCRVFATGDTASNLAINLLMLDRSFTLEEAPEELRAALRTISERIAAV
jgi:predicted DNA-binding transcriptional regulator YafY